MIGPLSWEQFMYARVYGDIAPWLEMCKQYPYYERCFYNVVAAARRETESRWKREAQEGRLVGGMFSDSVFG